MVHFDFHLLTIPFGRPAPDETALTGATAPTCLVEEPRRWFR